MPGKGHGRDESANVFNKVIRSSVGPWRQRGKLGQTGTGAQLAPSRRKFGMRDLWRIALWGLSAAGALFACRSTPRTTEIGRDRLLVAVAEIHEVLMPTGVKPIRPLDAREGRRLAETVRALAADRDRLLGPRRHARTEPRRHHRLDRPGREGRADAPPEPGAEPAPAGSAAKPAASEDVTSSISRAGRRRHIEHADAAAAARVQRQPRPNSASISAAPARSRRCAPPGPRRSAATARCSKACGPWCRCANGPARAAWNCASSPGPSPTPRRRPGSAPA